MDEIIELPNLESFSPVEPRPPEVYTWKEVFGVLSLDMAANFAATMGMDPALSSCLSQIKEISRSFLFAYARSQVGNETDQYVSDTFRHLNISLGEATEKFYRWAEVSFYDDASPAGMRESDWYDVFMLLRRGWNNGDEDVPWSRTVLPDLYVPVEESVQEENSICTTLRSIPGQPNALSKADGAILELQDHIRDMGLEHTSPLRGIEVVCNSISRCVSNHHVGSLRRYFQSALSEGQLETFYNWGRRHLMKLYDSDEDRPSEFFSRAITLRRD